MSDPRKTQRDGNVSEACLQDYEFLIAVIDGFMKYRGDECHAAMASGLRALAARLARKADTIDNATIRQASRGNREGLRHAA